MSNNDQTLKGWASTTLADVTDHHSGNSKLIKGRLSSHAGDALLPAFSATGQDVWRDDYEEEGDAVIVSAVGARCGKCFLASGKWSAIANTHVVRPLDNAIDVRFLWYRLNNERFWIRSGAAQPFVVVTKTLERDFMLPPFQEQKRIADKVDELFSELDASIKEIRVAQADLKRYRASVLAAACSGKLVPTEAELARHEGRKYETGAELLSRILTARRENWNGRGRFRESVSDINSPTLPGGWMWTTVAQIGDVQLGRQRSPQNISKKNPTKYIRAANITNNGLDLTDVLEMEFSLDEQQRFALHNGDIVLSEASGSIMHVGKPAIWRGELSLCCFQNTVIRFRTHIINEKFPFLMFKHFYINGVIAKIAGGVGINHLGADKFSNIPFPLPPAAEQARIVAEAERRLSVADEIENVLSVNLQRAERLRQSILQRAFNGKLMPQDPNDEPAAALLERMGVEHTSATAQKKVTSGGRGRPKAKTK